MTNTNTNFETIRTELEKSYTHVTFVSYDEVLGYSVWYVGEDMEIIRVSDSTALTTIAPCHEASQASRALDSYSRNTRSKLAWFREAMKLGCIAVDRNLYKKYTHDQLAKMVTAVQ